MLKKQIVILSIAVLLVSLSSCNLFGCKHKYTENVVAPTCTEDGYTEHTCQKCGESYTDSETEKLGHSYESEVVASNCFDEGYTKHTCSSCGDTYNDTYTEKTKHYFVGEACPNCGMEEITENITPNTEWYSEGVVIFELNTAEELAGLASLVNSGTNFSGVNIYLDSDIDLGFYEWIPIGNATYAFNGTFDGDGHTVSGLKINAGYDYVGLFGNATGKICNLTIEQANVYVKRDYKYVSILCGYSTGVLKDITTDGFIEAPKSNRVGAVAGWTAPSAMEYTYLTNYANINAQTDVGGIIGYINASGILQTNYIKNTGSVKGVNVVGGAFGYVKGANGSVVSGVSVSADIVGEWYVGGVVGIAENVAISSCTNDGSTVTANSYYTEGENFYAWIGGIVGYGYSVENCTNNVDITYKSKGIYVGGIAGYAVGNITDCTNNGDITTNTTCVGGIVGEITSDTERNISNLTNTGNISGDSKIGGIVGSYTFHWNKKASGPWYKDENIYGSKWYHYYGFVITMNEIELYNTGRVVAENEIVGGIIGSLDIYNSYEVKTTCHSGCIHRHDIRLVISGMGHSGEVVGFGKVGEIFGQFYTDGYSTLSNYTVTGKIIVNGELLEGTYDVGSKDNLTLSGREIYTEETPEENTEASE